jgi:hypothetical protein
MTASVLFMSMSLDGYIAGPNDEVGNPGGDAFDRLHSLVLGSGKRLFPGGRASGQAAAHWYKVA